ncbi:hypothetical protein Esti_003176 [Eimeria stiedai]
MAGQSPQPEPKAKKGASKSKPRPPKLLLSSDTSSSGDSSEASSSKTKEQRAAPLRVPSTLGQPAVSKKKSKGLQHEPSDERSGNAEPKPAWGFADPLLSVDFQTAAPSRIKSAVIVRGSSTKAPAASYSPSASMEVRSKEYQLLSRSTSKAAASKLAGLETVQVPSGKEVLRARSKGSALTSEKSRVTESPKGNGIPEDYGVKPSTPSRSSLSSREALTQSLHEPVPGDAWTSSLGDDATKMLKRDSSKVPVSRGEGQKSALSRKPSSVGAAPAKDSKVFAKQVPQLPSKRGGNADVEDASPWSDHSRSTSLQKLTTKQLSRGASAHQKSDARTGVDVDVFGEHEAPLAGNKKKLSELEAMLKETTARHKEELERQRAQNRALAEEVRKARSERDTAVEQVRKEADARVETRAKETTARHKEELERQRAQNRALAEEVQKARSERDTAIEQIRKEADARVEARAKENQAKIDEIKKEALACQNSTKMQCAASLRELKEQVASLEKQLKAKKEEFEDEKRLLKKSFDERRKSDIELQERKAQAHQEELKNKDSELLKQQSRVQALTSSVQTLTTSLAQMKELNDISRTATQALEEKSKTQAAYIKTLMKRDESLRSQAAKMMPIKEAKRLAFRALLKGRAVEMISRACMSTDAGLWNKAWAFQQFVDLIGRGRGSNEKRQDTIESRLMQFRKEQMFLMAENERLMAKVAQLQQEGVNQKQSKAALLEQALIADTTSLETSSTHDNRTTKDKQPSIRLVVLSVQHTVNKKVLWAFLRLQKATTEAESSTTIDKLQRKFNELRVSAYKDMAARIGSYRLTSYMKTVRQRLLYSAFFNFSGNAARRARDEALKQAEHHAVPRDPFSKESAAPEVPFNDVYTTFNQEYVDLNAPLAHQPHYYRQLPSVRNPARGRSVFVPMVQPSPPVKGYLPHPGYSNHQLTVGVPLVASRGRRLGTSPGIPNAFPSGPYDATQPVDERGAIYRMRSTQQDLRRVMMDVNDRGGTRILGKK